MFWGRFTRIFNQRFFVKWKIKENLEDFKTAVSSTVRSLTNSHKIEVTFGNQISKSDKNTIRLPNLERISNKINYEEIRAIADSKSLRLRFSNKKILKKART